VNCPCGTVFQLVPASNGTWTKNILYSFSSSSTLADGIVPEGPLVFDSKGNLYGTATAGGTNFAGVVFELTPASGGTWTETTLYSFTNGSDGRDPFAGVVFDSAGNLYGGASGGTSGFGLIFELVKGTNGTWTQKTLYNFSGGNDGASPTGTLIFDHAGNIYGVAQTAGAHDYGAIFELSPSSSGNWTEKVLYSFPGGYGGSYPQGGLLWGSAGQLYGIATFNLFELIPQSSGGWTAKTLHSFTGGKDGADALGALIFDKAGNLYGTTYFGGAHGGSVFELSPSSSGTWTEKILHRFSSNGTDGINPGVAVTLDSAGNLYGTTAQGGSSNGGVVFEVMP
jgi:uncharacterized repeat protein (TIGR03803 family)